MSDAEQFLDDARRAFGLASNATQTKSVERYAAMGREYLQLAHDAAELAVPSPKARPSWWKLS